MALDRMPRLGERIRFSDGSFAKVIEVKPDRIVWVHYEDGQRQCGSTCFIAQFADGEFNKLAEIVTQKESKLT